jgi:hypothetical protein
MSIKDLAYDIEQMYIEGFSPKYIAAHLMCDVELVYNWLETNSLEQDEIDPEEWDAAFPQQPMEEF